MDEGDGARFDSSVTSGCTGVVSGAEDEAVCDVPLVGVATDGTAAFVGDVAEPAVTVTGIEPSFRTESDLPS